MSLHESKNDCERLKGRVRETERKKVCVTLNMVGERDRVFVRKRREEREKVESTLKSV